jgi:hypothetical protein
MRIDVVRTQNPVRRRSGKAAVTTHRTIDTSSGPQPFEAALSGHARRLELADGRLMSLARRPVPQS